MSELHRAGSEARGRACAPASVHVDASKGRTPRGACGGTAIAHRPGTGPEAHAYCTARCRLQTEEEPGHHRRRPSAFATNAGPCRRTVPRGRVSPCDGRVRMQRHGIDGQRRSPAHHPRRSGHIAPWRWPMSSITPVAAPASRNATRFMAPPSTSLARRRHRKDRLGRGQPGAQKAPSLTGKYCIRYTGISCASENATRASGARVYLGRAC